MFKAGEKAFIVESNRFIREVTVKSCAVGMYLIKFEDAEASIPKEKSKKTRSPYDYM